MRSRCLRSVSRTFVFGSILLLTLVIITDICLLNRGKCFESLGVLNAVSLVERLSFPDSSNTFDDQENAHYLQGGLNQHVWENDCLKTLQLLCSFPIFPKAPYRRNLINRTEIRELKDTRTDAHRLFGFILPNLTGEYQFAVASNGDAEIWLSRSKNWRSAERIAFIKPYHGNSAANGLQVVYNVSETQISTGIHLQARNRYYIEILYSLGTRNTVHENFVHVAWKRPQELHFEVIKGDYLLLFKNESSEMGRYAIFDDELPDAKACDENDASRRYGNKHMTADREIISFLEHTAVSKALPSCKYQPSYVPDLKNVSNLKRFRQYDGISRYVQKTYTFPISIAEGVVRDWGLTRYFTEFPLAEEEVWSIVEEYMNSLKVIYSGRYYLNSIRRVEKKEDSVKGVRYLIEVVITDLMTDKTYILSEYVFRPKSKNPPLCYPEGLQWNKTTDVYLILTAKNLGRWVHHFIKNMEKIVQQTKDEHLHVVIYDFDSPDISLTEAFQRTTLKNYHFIRKPGKYSRTVSFIEAIDSIKNPNAIVVTTDLHLDIGSQFIDDIRKHCVKGKTIYAPAIVFLKCGGSSSKPKGFWYDHSYGTIAMYKQDWDNIGGFSDAFIKKTSWGGEDWDLIDSSVKGGLEIERKRSPWVYHYFHTKKGMWGSIPKNKATG
ncbi:uncharacterized protein [Montipora capricornis]|uniref:uncharacterized protein n=1 Tax=Montipora capricornis TaxID=246305 RepID=UPI0035F1A380